MIDQASCHHCGLPVPAGRRANGNSPGFCCFGCRFAHELAGPVSTFEAGDAPRPAGTLLLRLGLGIFLTLNIMVASWLSYSREIYGAQAQAQGADVVLPAMFSYLALFLCTLLVAMLGLPLLNDTAGRINAQTLIVVGVFAAYLLSAVHTLRGEGSLYYDTAAVVLVIVTLGSYLEAGAKQRAATAASHLLANLPSSVRIRRGVTTYEVSAEELRSGDLVQVRPGETLPVDGVVSEGRSRIDEASLTGESRPRAVEPGDPVLAGALSLDGQLWLRADQVGGGTVLAQMERSLEAARAQRPEVQRLADRIAAVFVPAVVAVALTVLGVRAWQGEVAKGLLDGLAVLLISCPCALGLAAPLACWHGLRRAAQRGILIDGAPTLERAAAIDRLYFDKTGTLTRPEPALDRVAVAAGTTPRQALAWAAGLESASTHPIARCLLRLAGSRDANLWTPLGGDEPPVPRQAATVAGLGVEGNFGEVTLRLGSRRWVEHCGFQEQGLVREAPADLSSVYLIGDAHVLARFDLAEKLRPRAASAVAELRRMGIEVRVLSGDRSEPTRRVAEQLGVAAEAELFPDDKVRDLTAARASGGRLAMVGDGINDAPVLAASDVGIALGSASDLARRSGNVRLLSDRLQRVPELLRIARDVRRRIRANLIWAFGFNSVGVGLAAAGWLTPVFAAIAMVLSSLTVVRISSRAGRLSEDPVAPKARPEGAVEPPTPDLRGPALAGSAVVSEG